MSTKPKWTQSATQWMETPTTIGSFTSYMIQAIRQQFLCQDPMGYLQVAICYRLCLSVSLSCKYTRKGHEARFSSIEVHFTQVFGGLTICPE